MLGNFAQQFVNLIVSTISSAGYAGVFLLMLIEGAIGTVPSWIVMPFAGYVVFTGQMDFWFVVFTAAAANLVGSLITYTAGAWLGRVCIMKYCKYVLLSKNHIILAEKWFKKHGAKAVFIGKMLPFVRAVISLPAGIARMNLKKFLLYTFAGSLVWCFMLAYAGVWLGSSWESVYRFGYYTNLLIISAILFASAWYFFKCRKSRPIKFEKFRS